MSVYAQPCLRFAHFAVMIVSVKINRKYQVWWCEEGRPKQVHRLAFEVTRVATIRRVIILGVGVDLFEEVEHFEVDFEVSCSLAMSIVSHNCTCLPEEPE